MRISRRYTSTEKMPLHKKPRRKINYRYFNLLRSLGGSQKPQAYTLFETLYKTNFYLKVYYIENTPLNFC